MIDVINTYKNQTWINIDHVYKLDIHPQFDCVVVIGANGEHLVYTYESMNSLAQRINRARVLGVTYE